MLRVPFGLPAVLSLLLVAVVCTVVPLESFGAVLGSLRHKDRRLRLLLAGVAGGARDRSRVCCGFGAARLALLLLLHRPSLLDPSI